MGYETLGLTSYLEKLEGIYGLRDSWADFLSRKVRGYLFVTETLGLTSYLEKLEGIYGL